MSMTVRQMRMHLNRLPMELDDYELVIDHGMSLLTLEHEGSRLDVPRPAPYRIPFYSVANPNHENKSIALEM